MPRLRLRGVFSPFLFARILRASFFFVPDGFAFTINTSPAALFPINLFQGETAMHAFKATKRLAALAALWAVGSLAGCNYGPDETVTIEISGVASDQSYADINDRLKQMTDSSSHKIISRRAGLNMTVELAPVADPEAFARKIDFGKVTAVEGRTIKVVMGLP